MSEMAAVDARFSNLELIGRGSFGDVFRGFDKELNKEVAIKVIDLEEAEDEIEDIQKEISVLSQCRSPYITDYYGSFLHQTKLWIVMEYMAGGSVADLLQSGPPLDEMSIACILRDLLRAVEYLHNEGKIHRDIKAANILLTENGDVKVADFGVSGQLTNTISRRKRPSAKELLKLRFIRTARKSPRLLEKIRERPKFPVHENIRTQRNDEDASNIIRAVGDARDDFAQFSQRKSPRTTSRDLSIDGSLGTGTVRSALKPPPVSAAREKRQEASLASSLTRKLRDTENKRTSVSGNVLDDSSYDSGHEEHDKRMGNDSGDSHLLPSGSGTVIVRSPKENSVYTAFSNQNRVPVSGYTSSEDVSISGTVVLRNELDESDTPRASKSRLGVQEKASTALTEDSATNLSEAKAALKAGFRRGNARERPLLVKQDKEALESKGTERTTNSDSSRDSSGNFGLSKVPFKLHEAPDNEYSGPASPSSPALAMLIIPSLKEVGGDKLESSGASTAIEALIDLEKGTPGSCEALVGRMLQRLASSKESSMKGLQDLAARSFAKTSGNLQDPPDSKKHPMPQPVETPSLSSLARLLLARWQGNVSQDLKSI